MNCLNCGAPMQLRLNLQHFYCEYCESRYFPEQNEEGLRILDEASEIPCPVCKINLVYGYIGETQLYYCNNCRGMLFNQDSFLDLIKFLRKVAPHPPVEPPPVDLSELKRRLKCPTCDQTMSTHLYGGPGNLVVDNCSICLNLWLDHKEFTRIIQAPGRDKVDRESNQEQKLD